MRSVHPKLHTATRSPYVQGMRESLAALISVGME